MIAWFWTAALAALVNSTAGAPRVIDHDLTAVNPDAKSVRAPLGGVLALQWRQPVVRTGFYRSLNESFGRPALSSRHGMVVVGTGEGKVIGMAWADGHEVWRRSYGLPFETGAAVVRGAGGQEMAVLGARDGTLVAVDVVTGKPYWRTSIEGDMRAAPQQSGDKLVITTAANKVVAVQASTGTVLWTQGRPPTTSLSVEGHARAAIDGKRVYATFSDGYIAAFDLEHGTGLWSRPLSLKGGTAFVDADADPFVANNRIFVASYSDGVYALDPEDGQTVWNRAVRGVTSIVAQGDLVVAGSADGFVWGLRQQDGERRYRSRVATGPVSRMLPSGNMLAFTAGDSGLVVLRADTGEPLQASAFGGRAAGDPVCAGNSLAFLTSSGYLYAWDFEKPGTACAE